MVGHMTDAVQAIFEAARASDEAARHLIRAAGGSPIRNGRTHTFFYIGEAEAVGLHHWMDIFPALPSFRRESDSPLWHLTVELPERARIEYKLSVKRNGRRRLVLDSLNPRRAHDPFGTNSLVTGPAYVRPEWSLPDPAIPAGAMADVPIDSAVFGDTRHLQLYLPPGYTGEPLPLLVAHDGAEYVEYASLTSVLDNLINAGDIPPIACVLTNPVARTHEYTADERHAAHLADEVIPAAAQLANVGGPIAAMGASLGGVASLHAAWRSPGTFAGLILHSGSFVTALGGPHRRGAVFEPVVEFMSHWRAAPGVVPDRIYVSCGRFDGLIAENRMMNETLRTLGAAVAYDESADGHHWENWRDHLRPGLMHAFTG